jgi:integrase/recombinase XerC
MYIESFLQYIQFEKRYSEHTLSSYNLDLKQFFEYLHRYYPGSEREVNREMVRSWLAELRENGLDPRSVNRKISTLRSYFKFLRLQGISDHNPVQGIKALRISKKLPVFIEQEKMRILLEETPFPEGFAGFRDRLMLEVFYCTGIRLSELINLEVRNIDLVNCTLKVLGKRNKERIIPFSLKVRPLLSEYLKFRGLLYSEEAVLFISEKGKKLYPKLVYRLIGNYLGAVSTRDKKSPHVLRHTFATHMLNNGADINAIKEILGHASLAATQVYTHNNIEKLKDIYKQAHPRA